MIPYILIIAGAASVLCGVIGVIRIAFLPLVRAHQVVFKRRDDYLFYENEKGKRLLRSQKKFLMNIYITLIVVGALVITAGFYAGFTEHGPKFWLYKKFFSLVEEIRSDKITEEGKYVASDGKEYSYYIFIRGSEVFFGDEPCADISALEEKAKGVDRSNTIVVYDDFAVSSTYHSVTDLLDSLGIQYIEEGN
ncbi:MAG TPA: hypothetical protein DCL38_08760 [Lachnospiraceae bacterium]|nr:hypothetical protein [Lachnospiraceae bacterium]